MANGPSRGEMMNPQNAQSGKPDYIDDSAEEANSNFYPDRGQDAPAYVASNPRYWEYR